MLKILDRNNRTVFVLRDEDEEPLSIDELILREKEPLPEEIEENIDAE